MEILYNGSHEIGIKVESHDTIESIAAHTHFTTSELVDIIQDVVDNDKEYKRWINFERSNDDKR